MADLDALTLDSPADQNAAERELRRQAVLDQQRQSALTAADKQRQVRQSSTDKNRQLAAALDTPANMALRQGYIRIWQWAQEGVEDLAFTFVDGMVFTGPIAIAIYFTRLIFGTFFKGSGTIGWKGIEVPRVPGYSFWEGVYRSGKITVILIISISIYVVGGIVSYFIFHPQELVGLALGNLADIIKLLGIGS